jgi:hypothetical protein
VADNQAININLDGLEEVFKILGWKAGVAVLDQRIAEFVKSADPKVARFLKEMEKYDSPRLQGSPCSENNTQKENMEKYFAPTKRLQDFLCEPWFDEASSDKKKYTIAWRNQLIEDMMKSEHRDEVAKAWANKDHRLQVKGRVTGALVAAGVFLKKKYTPIARIYYGTREDTAESDTLANYMGQYKKSYYGGWIVDYVTKRRIEK